MDQTYHKNETELVFVVLWFIRYYIPNKKGVPLIKLKVNNKNKDKTYQFVELAQLEVIRSWICIQYAKLPEIKEER